MPAEIHILLNRSHKKKTDDKPRAPRGSAGIECRQQLLGRRMDNVFLSEEGVVWRQMKGVILLKEGIVWRQMDGVCLSVESIVWHQRDYIFLSEEALCGAKWTA